MSDCATIFESIYRDKHWGDGSGGGSRPEAALPFADIATRIIRKLLPAVVLDIGAGDGWTASHIDLGKARYVGIDAALSIVAHAQEHHGWGVFLQRDALTEPLPVADLVLLKEVTQHLDDASVHVLLHKLRKYPAILHCSALSPGDAGAVTGGYRPVRLKDFGVDTLSYGEWKAGDTPYHAELWRP